MWFIGYSSLNRLDLGQRAQGINNRHYIRLNATFRQKISVTKRGTQINLDLEFQAGVETSNTIRIRSRYDQDTNF
jgi:hypothetical protein